VKPIAGDLESNFPASGG